MFTLLELTYSLVHKLKRWINQSDHKTRPFGNLPIKESLFSTNYNLHECNYSQVTNNDKKSGDKKIIYIFYSFTIFFQLTSLIIGELKAEQHTSLFETQAHECSTCTWHRHWRVPCCHASVQWQITDGIYMWPEVYFNAGSKCQVCGLWLVDFDHFLSLTCFFRFVDCHGNQDGKIKAKMHTRQNWFRPSHYACYEKGTGSTDKTRTKFLRQ